jgi:hypothetical protein
VYVLTDVVAAVALLGGGVVTTRGARGGRVWRRVVAALAVAGLTAAGCTSPNTGPNDTTVT